MRSVQMYVRANFQPFDEHSVDFIGALTLQLFSYIYSYYRCAKLAYSLTVHYWQYS